MSVSILRVAKTLGELSDFQLSNLEMQKISFIAEMLHLGRNNGSALIREDFEAWDRGPVVPELYKWAKMFGAKPVKNIFTNVAPLREDGTRYKAVHDAYEMMRSFSPWKMVNITHQHDGAWAKHYKANRRGIVIPKSDIAAEYNVRISGE